MSQTAPRGENVETLDPQAYVDQVGRAARAASVERCRRKSAEAVAARFRTNVVAAFLIVLFLPWGPVGEWRCFSSSVVL